MRTSSSTARATHDRWRSMMMGDHKNEVKACGCVCFKKESQMDKMPPHVEKTKQLLRICRHRRPIHAACSGPARGSKRRPRRARPAQGRNSRRVHHGSGRPYRRCAASGPVARRDPLAGRVRKNALGRPAFRGSVPASPVDRLSGRRSLVLWRFGQGAGSRLQERFGVGPRDAVAVMGSSGQACLG